MGGPPPKRARHNPPSDAQVGQGGILSDVKVFFLERSIPNSQTRMKVWRRLSTTAGFQIANAVTDEGVTHVIVGSNGARDGDIPVTLRRRPLVVGPEWLEACLRTHQHVAESSYVILAQASESEGSEGRKAEVQAGGRMRRLARWLGRWEPAFDEFTSELDIVLQADFSEGPSMERGNEPLVRTIVELMKYEDAIEPEYHQRENGEGEAHLTPNIHSLMYAKAAAAVRGCSYRVTADLRPGQLPFVGKAIAERIRDILRTGTTPVLDAHRNNEQVYSSSGMAREGAVGGSSRRLFKKLPGVGAKTAQRWWELGMRTLEDVAEAAKPGGPLAPGGVAPLSVAQRFSLEQRHDMLEACPEPDILQMERVVLDAIARYSGEAGGWMMVRVGGSRRAKASHDADFIITHPTRSVDGLVEGLHQGLVAEGRLMPAEKAMCLVQVGRMPDHLPYMRRQVADEAPRDVHNLQEDRFDHIFGNFRTSEGRYRRIDLIISPWEEYPFCLLGWTGSRQYLRFLRQYAKDIKGMNLNSHRLMRKDGGSAYIVPDERPPLDRNGREYWPPGWDATRRVTCERDILELLGVPYLQPHQRNCP